MLRHPPLCLSSRRIGVAAPCVAPPRPNAGLLPYSLPRHPAYGAPARKTPAMCATTPIDVPASSRLQETCRQPGAPRTGRTATPDRLSGPCRTSADQRPGSRRRSGRNAGLPPCNLPRHPASGAPARTTPARCPDRALRNARGPQMAGDVPRQPSPGNAEGTDAVWHPPLLGIGLSAGRRPRRSAWPRGASPSRRAPCSGGSTRRSRRGGPGRR